MRAALARHRHELRRVDVARHRLAFLAHAAVVIDAEVAADADEPGLEIRAPIERVQRLEDLEEDVLRQILGLVMAADELVGEVEDLAPVLADDLLPRRLIACETALDELVGVGAGAVAGWIAGHQTRRRRLADAVGNAQATDGRCQMTVSLQ